MLNGQDEAIDKLYPPQQESWILKTRYLPTPIITTIGLGIEKQLGSKLSVLCILNCIRFSTKDFEKYQGVIYSIKPEIRYNFYEKSNQGFFLSNFLDYGYHSSPYKEDINEENYTFERGGFFCGVGMLTGRNFSINKKFHVDLYIGPKYRWKNETIVNIENQVLSESQELNAYWGIRVGFNINYTLN